MNNRKIQFRQPIFEADKFDRWHIWGFIDDEFVAPYDISGSRTTSYQLTDLPGEVWEGDIIDVDGKVGVVEMAYGRWCILTKCHGQKLEQCYIAIYEKLDCENIQILGNLEENKEFCNEGQG